MEEKNSILQMDFIGYDGKTVTVRFSGPREDLTDAEVTNLMNLFVDLKVLAKVHGPNFDNAGKIKGAKVVDTVTNEFEITVE